MSRYTGPAVPTKDEHGHAVIWLIGRGWTAAIRAGELRVGDTLVYNYGSRYVIQSLEYRGQSVYITEQSMTGETYQRRRLARCLVGVTHATIEAHEGKAVNTTYADRWV